MVTLLQSGKLLYCSVLHPVLVVLLVSCWGVINLVFEFIQNPQSTVDLCYNLFLFDSIFLVGYLGYVEIRKLISKIRGGARRNARISK